MTSEKEISTGLEKGGEQVHMERLVSDVHNLSVNDHRDDCSTNVKVIYQRQDTDEHGYICPHQVKRHPELEKDIPEDDKHIYLEIHPELSEAPPLPPRSPRTPVSVFLDSTDNGDITPISQVDIPSESYALITGFPVDALLGSVELFVADLLNLIGQFTITDFDSWTGEAVLQLQSKEEADKIVAEFKKSPPVQYQKHRLTARKYRPLAIDAHSVLICGISHSTTDDVLKEYLTNKCNLKPKSVVRGERLGAAVVSFVSKPDIEHLKKVCQLRACGGQFLEVSPVKETKCIKVTGYSESTSHDTLRTHLGKLASYTVGGIEECDGDSARIVYMRNTKDATTISKYDHVLDGKILTVMLYYPCLENCPREVAIVPRAFTVPDIDRYMIRYLKSCGQNSIIKTLKQFHAMPVWSKTHPPVLRIVCTVDTSDPLFYEKVRNWKNQCMDAIQETFGKLAMHKEIFFAIEIQGKLHSYITSLEAADNVAFFFDLDECRLIIVGESHTVSMFSNKISQKINKLEEDSSSDIITMKLKPMSNQKKILVGASGLSEYILSQREGCVEITADKGIVLFKGTRRSVQTVHSRARQSIKKLHKQPLPDFSTLSKELLCKADRVASKYVEKHLNKTNSLQVLTVAHNGTLVLYSSDTNELDSAVLQIKQLLKEDTLPIEKNLLADNKDVKGLDSFVKTIQEKNSGFVDILVTDHAVEFATVEFLEKSVKDEINEFLNNLSVISKVVLLDPGKFWFLQNFKSRDLETLLQDHKDVEIGLVNDSLRKGFRVKGKKCNCRKVICCLHSLVDDISQHVITMEWPGFEEFVKTENGKLELGTLQLRQRYHCIVRGVSQKGRSKEADVYSESTKYAQCSISKFNISLHIGDIAGLSADTLVCPTSLDIDDECALPGISEREWVITGTEKFEKTPHTPCVGSIIQTTAGELAFHAIFHVVVPHWKDGKQKEEQVEERLTASIIYDCLELAGQRGFTTIAFPPMTSGRFPPKALAHAMFSSIKSYISEKCENSDLVNIVVCIKPEDELATYMEALSEGFGSISIVQKGTNTLHRGPLTVDIASGSLVDQNVDVLVNSTNPQLNLGIGELSKHILGATGEQLQYECRQQYPDGIRFGQVAVTSSGNLCCKAIFHGLLPKWLDGQSYSETVLSIFIWNCLQTANEKNYCSIVFPMIGTGQHGIPHSIVAKTLFSVVNKFKMDVPNSSIGRVCFLAHIENQDAIQALQTVHDEMESGPHLSPGLAIPHAFLSLFNNITQRQPVSTSIGDITVNVFQGDLTRQTTSVIVNSVHDIANLCTGNISRAILEAAGPHIQTECYTEANKELFKDSKLIVTGPGRLLCQNIIHIKARSSTKKWKQAILETLQKVDNLSHTSVSFPALGTGCKGFSPEEIGKAMFLAIKEYMDDNPDHGSVKVVNIVPIKCGMAEKFVSSIKHQQSLLVGRARESGIMNMIWRKSSTEEDLLTINIYADTTKKAENVEQRLKHLCNQLNALDEDK